MPRHRDASTLLLTHSPSGNGRAFVHADVYADVSSALSVQVEGEEHEQKYSHIFHLLPLDGSYWVQNEMFRLHVG